MDNRFLVAILLSALVLFLWFGVVVPLVSPPVPPPEPGAEAPEEPAGKSDAPPPEGPKAPDPAPGPAEPPPEEPPAFEATRAGAAQPVLLAAEDFHVVLRNEGAALERIVLETFLDPTQSEPYPLVTEVQEGVRSLLVSVDGCAEALDTAPWEIVETRTPREALFRFRTSRGLEITKRYRLPEEIPGVPTCLEIELRVRNLAETERPLVARITGPAGIPVESPDYPSVYAYVATGVDARRPTVKDVAPSKVREEPVVVSGTRYHWAGLGNKYFASVLLPDDPESVDEATVSGLLDSSTFRAQIERGKGATAARAAAATNLHTVLRLKTPNGLLLPGGEAAWGFRLYAGPKDDYPLEVLHIEGVRTSMRAFCFPASWTRGLSWVMLKILLFFEGIVANFGIAILFLTFLARACMFPLSIRMQVSMNDYQKKMRKIQPKMQEIKERYKDKQRQQQEMAKLMREHGVSLLPLKGCLPIFLQFPIFIALFATLQNSIELRHAGFLYIRDLASPDRLFPFPAVVSDIPLLGGVLGSHFNLLPVLWIGMMLLQQRITPQPQTDDPQMASQRKMMLVMSIVFGVLFFKIQSGCALYILTSTVWGMGESYLIRRRIKAQEQA